MNRKLMTMSSAFFYICIITVMSGCLAPYFGYLDSIEAHNGKTFITVSAMNSLKETKLTLAMNCHRIVILYNEKIEQISKTNIPNTVHVPNLYFI